jgi:hypothetical protein
MLHPVMRQQWYTFDNAEPNRAYYIGISNSMHTILIVQILFTLFGCDSDVKRAGDIEIHYNNIPSF